MCIVIEEVLVTSWESAGTRSATNCSPANFVRSREMSLWLDDMDRSVPPRLRTA